MASLAEWARLADGSLKNLADNMRALCREFLES